MTMSARRLKLTIAYDGRPWKGWQSQPCGVTVQDQLEAVFGSIVSDAVSVQGSGRTDAGVHARGQVAHVDVPERFRLQPQDWIKALNVRLPASIRVVGCEDAPQDFHARFSATGKVYEYRVWRGAVLSPFEAGLAHHVWGRLDLELLREGAAALCGTHNFARLSANRGDITEAVRRENVEGLTRTIRRIDVIEDGEVLRLVFEGDGFMYKMVRLLTGSLIHMARGKLGLDWLRDLVLDPTGEKSNHCAPADGLYLMCVLYDNRSKN